MVDYFKGSQVLHAQHIYRHHFRTHWQGYGHYSFLLITEGTIYLQREDGPRYEFSAPAAFWLHPKYEYDYGTIRKDLAWSHYFAAFTGPKVKALMEKGFMQLSPTSFSTNVDLRFGEALFEKMITLLEQDSPYRDSACFSQLEAYLLHLLEHRAPSPNRSPYQPAILELATHLQHNPTKTMDFPAWAQAHGMSYSNFRLQFRQLMQTSPQRFLDRLRLNWARQQMLSTSIPIQEIGYQLGFENPAVFSRAFRRQFKISGQELRRLQRQH